jgi:RNA polymerase sigma-70 factor, ECF subfamily
VNWREFIDRFHNVILRAVHRVARRWGDTSPATREDLVQDVYLKLCRNRLTILKELPGDPEDATKFIHVVATNLAIDQFRAAHARVHGGGVTHVSVEENEELASRDGAAGTASVIEREILLGQIAKFLQGKGASKRDAQIFWFYYRHGMKSREIAMLPWIGLTTEGVESVIHRLTAQVRGFIAEGPLRCQQGTGR